LLIEWREENDGVGEEIGRDLMDKLMRKGFSEFE
jgi:hypothetical protein